MEKNNDSQSVSSLGIGELGWTQTRVGLTVPQEQTKN